MCTVAAAPPACGSLGLAEREHGCPRAPGTGCGCRAPRGSSEEPARTRGWELSQKQLQARWSRGSNLVTEDYSRDPRKQPFKLVRGHQV